MNYLERFWDKKSGMSYREMLYSVTINILNLHKIDNRDINLMKFSIQDPSQTVVQPFR